jgi:hypothetical protein
LYASSDAIGNIEYGFSVFPLMTHLALHLRVRSGFRVTSAFWGVMRRMPFFPLGLYCLHLFLV